MLTLYALITIVYMYTLYDALYRRKNFEQVFYLAFSAVSISLLPILYIGPIPFFVLYGFAYGIFVHDTEIGKFIINKNAEEWSTDTKCLLHGIISTIRHLIIGFGVRMVLCNNFIENIEQKLVKLFMMSMMGESYGF